VLCIPAINGIEGCINLKELNLSCCDSLAGLFSGHHPMMTPFYQLTIRVAGERKQVIKSMMQTQVPGCTVRGVD
jgi:hypothetical protein